MYPTCHDMEPALYYSSVWYLLLILGGVVVAVGEAQYPSCSLCLAMLSSSFRGILRYSQARWDNPSSELWIVPWGPLPADSSWIISKAPRRHHHQISRPAQLAPFEVNDQQLYSERPPDVWGPHWLALRLLGRNSFWLLLSTIPILWSLTRAHDHRSGFKQIHWLMETFCPLTQLPPHHSSLAQR